MPSVLTHHIIQDARLPALEVQAFDANGTLNLSAATSPKFYMSRPGTDAKIDGVTAVIVDGALGKLRYDWASGDTDTPGMWEGQFEVQINSKPLRIPSHGHIAIEVGEKT